MIVYNLRKNLSGKILDFLMIGVVLEKLFQDKSMNGRLSDAGGLRMRRSSCIDVRFPEVEVGEIGLFRFAVEDDMWKQPVFPLSRKQRIHFLNGPIDLVVLVPQTDKTRIPVPLEGIEFAGWNGEAASPI